MDNDRIVKIADQISANMRNNKATFFNAFNQAARDNNVSEYERQEVLQLVGAELGRRRRKKK